MKIWEISATNFKMASKLSAAYVQLGKATMTEPADFSAAVAALAQLSSLLTCTSCGLRVGSSPKLEQPEVGDVGKPETEPGLLCDSCHSFQNQPVDPSVNKADHETMAVCLDNVSMLCSFVMAGMKDEMDLLMDSDEDSEVELSKRLSRDEVVVVPVVPNRRKMAIKLRQFARCYLDLDQVTVDNDNDIQTTPEVVVTTTPKKAKTTPVKRNRKSPAKPVKDPVVQEVSEVTAMDVEDEPEVVEETISVTAPPVPKAVIVTSPVSKANNGGTTMPPLITNGSKWIKVCHQQSPSPVKSPVKRTTTSHVVINGSKFGRDQIVKTTLRPNLGYATLKNGIHLTNGTGASMSGSNGGLGPPSSNRTVLNFVKQNGQQASDILRNNVVQKKMSDYVVQLSHINGGTTTGAGGPTNKSQLVKRASIAGTVPGSNRAKKGCRCGNATTTPGKLTCGGQRCPCYVVAKTCQDCKCKGCRNPHRENGTKIIRPQLQLKNFAPTTNGTGSTFYMTNSGTAVQIPSLTTTAIKRIHLG